MRVTCTENLLVTFAKCFTAKSINDRVADAVQVDEPVRLQRSIANTGI